MFSQVTQIIQINQYRTNCCLNHLMTAYKHIGKLEDKDKSKLEHKNKKIDSLQKLVHDKLEN